MMMMMMMMMMIIIIIIIINNNKYAPLRLELKRQHPGYKIRQFNIVIDAFGGYSRSLKDEVKTLVGSDRYQEVLRRMQKAVLSHTLHKSCAGHFDTFGGLMR